MQVILLPGLDGTGALTAPVGAYLGPSYKAEVVQYPAGLFRYDDVARWLQPHLPTDDFVIVAESFSGPLAIRVAAARPSGLKALVLVASFARSPRLVPAFFAAILYFLPIRSVLLIRLTRWFLVGNWGARDFPEAFVKIIGPVPRKTLAGRLRAVLKVNVVDDLKAVEGPRLLVVASGDRLVPASRAGDFRAAGWEVETVEGPHFLTLTRPQAVATVISAFLAKHGLGAADG
ncbi:MAG: alpha/beta hydrolase [Rhodobacterales bacterium]|nr:alpha/beta hydrolase [Rhodobacterales bacterium]